MPSIHLSKQESLMVRIKGGGEEAHENLYQPMSPSSQLLNTSVFSQSIIAIAESEIPITESKILATLKKDLLRVSSRFSSVVVTDPKGLQWWKRVEVLVENHVIIPSFPLGLSKEDYTLHFKNYLSKITQEPLPVEQPLWEFHIFKYPTCTCTETIIFKMHHAIGDGFSIMGAIFSCLKRADNPELPLTFPSFSTTTTTTTTSGSGNEYLGLKNLMKGVSRFVAVCWNTTSDFVSGVLRSTLLEDDRTVIRSGTKGVEFLPIEITTIDFSLDNIRQVKLKAGGTVNDVVVGLIFYGIHLYNQAKDSEAISSRSSALVVLNTRMVKGYRNIEEMLEKNLWGNNYSFIHLSIPSYGDQERIDDPLKFIINARKIIQKKRNSMCVYLNSLLLRLLGSLRGIEAVSHYVHSTVHKSTVGITNLAGPVEKMAIAEHPISNIYFTVSGNPQSLLCSVVSYMGKLTLVLTTEKGFIDSQLLASCMKEAFEKIFEASCGGET